MKLKSSLYAPILFGVILILAGMMAPLTTLLQRVSQEPFLSTAIIQLLVYLLPLAFYCRVRGLNLLSTLKFRYVTPKKIPFLVVTVLIFVTGTTILRYFGLFFFNGAFVDTPAAVYVPLESENGFLIALCGIVLPAILEELVFRGVLLEEYRSYGSCWAVGMSAVLFALIHASLENFFFYLFFGLILGVMTVFADSIVPGIVLQILMNASYFYFRPGVVEYLRQAGKSPLLPYLLLAFFLLLFVILFARLQTIYQDKAYEEMFQSRKELLRQEIERARSAREEAKQETRSATFFSVFKELYLSPTFLLSCAVFLCLALGIFEK